METAAGQASAASDAFSATSKAPSRSQYVVDTASRINLPWLTLYAFSLENNLRRPKTEVNFLMRLLRSYLVDNVERMNDNNVRIAYIGRTHELPSEVQEKMQWAAEPLRATTAPCSRSRSTMARVLRWWMQ